MIRQIKKYPNRRLYDTGESRYISNDDVGEIIINGDSLNIIDVKSGSDITRSVLLNILAERESCGQTCVLTQALLSEIVRFNDEFLFGILSVYLEQSLRFFLQNKEFFRTQLRDMDGENPINTINQLFNEQCRFLQQKISN